MLAADLSGRFDHVLHGTSSALPLFFLLDSSGSWHPLNDGTVQGAGLFQWSLPQNLFRHRFAQQLARCGVNPEVIDGWMGHGERGATTYSDHSARCWKEDAERYHQTLNDCFDRLGFLIQLPETTYDEIQVQPRSQTDDYREPTHFGQAKRHMERLQARDQARA